MFKNMKIAITDEAHLKAVCEVLESMGYKPCEKNSKYKSLCTWEISGVYDIYDMHLDEMYYHDLEVTLSDLLHMRDEMVKENIKPL